MTKSPSKETHHHIFFSAHVWMTDYTPGLKSQPSLLPDHLLTPVILSSHSLDIHPSSLPQPLPDPLPTSETEFSSLLQATILFFLQNRQNPSGSSLLPQPLLNLRVSFTGLIYLISILLCHQLKIIFLITFWPQQVLALLSFRRYQNWPVCLVWMSHKNEALHKNRTWPHWVMPYLFFSFLLTPISSELHIWRFEVQEINTQ